MSSNWYKSRGYDPSQRLTVILISKIILYSIKQAVRCTPMIEIDIEVRFNDKWRQETVIRFLMIKRSIQRQNRIQETRSFHKFFRVFFQQETTIRCCFSFGRSQYIYLADTTSGLSNLNRYSHIKKFSTLDCLLPQQWRDYSHWVAEISRFWSVNQWRDDSFTWIRQIRYNCWYCL